LTLTLSLGEREQPPPAANCAHTGLAKSAAGIAQSQRTILPLPKGEGRGEGKVNVAHPTGPGVSVPLAIEVYAAGANYLKRACSSAPRDSAQKSRFQNQLVMNHTPGSLLILLSRFKWTNASAAPTPASRPRQFAMTSWCCRQIP